LIDRWPLTPASRLVRRHATRFGLTAVDLPFKRKADPIQAVTTKAAMLDAGPGW
jgi:hypothetical protein